MNINDITLLFIDHEPFSRNRARLFCVDGLREKGFKIVWLDVSQMIYPGLHVADEICTDYLMKISSFEKLEEIIGSLNFRTTLSIVEVFENLKNFKIFELLEKNHIKRIRFERFGSTDLYKNVKKSLKDLLTMFTWKRFMNHLILKKDSKLLNLLKQEKHLEFYNYYINSSTLSKCDISVNHPDYDAYLTNDKKMHRTIDTKYAVFIDTSFGIHPDVIYFAKRKYKKNVDKIWRNKLVDFFDYVEKKYGVEVVIASHPKTNYETNAFGERRIIKYETLNLVKFSEFVLMDFSSAFSYSVIYDKKIGIISTKEFYKEFGHNLRTFTTKMELPLFMIDKDDYDTFEPRKLNKEKREEFLYTYLTSRGNEAVSTVDILSRDLPAMLT